MRALALLALTTVACSKPPPAPPPPPAQDPPPTEPVEPELEKVESNMPCVTGEARCDAGVCAVDVQNACPATVTCELEVMALCKSETEGGEAKGVARDTIAAGARVKLEAGGNCEGRIANATQVEKLSCR